MSTPDVPMLDMSQSWQIRPVTRALVSVHDKTGLADLVTELHQAGVQLVSTGGSAAAIEAAGVPVTRVESVTGFPECLDGRVKTLHPGVHAGLLADLGDAEHVRQLEELGIEPFGLLVVNLYPFTRTVASGASEQDCIEQIDIGGPAMVRAAAKNCANVAVVTDPARYPEVVQAVRTGGFSLVQRQRLAAEAFAHTAGYDVAVASWLGNVVVDTSDGTGFPGWAGATWRRAEVLRYGENPHQPAALYVGGGATGLAQATQLHGKAMSYNNYLDADAALRAAYDQGDVPTCAIIKHANPCGIALGDDIAQAHAKAHACDPTSAYGGIIAVNRPVTVDMAEAVADIFTEVVLAPAYEEAALSVLTRKKNIRLLTCPEPVRGGAEVRPITGGLLMQRRDTLDAVVRDPSGAVIGGDDPTAWRLVSGQPADAATLGDLAFAWRAIRAVKSNAILLARDLATVGIGMGQVNRVDSCRLAVTRAGAQRADGAAAASDAFFPFADGLQVLLDAGVRAVVAPGGSVRDAEVVEAAQSAGVTMYLTGTRHFAH